MAYAKFLSSQLVGTAVVAAGAVVQSEQGFINTAVKGGAAIQIDQSSLSPSYAKAWSLSTKSAALDLALAASTPQTLDMTALVPGAGGSMAGRTSFAKVFVVEVFNNAAIGSGINVTIGNDGTSAEFFLHIGTVTQVVIIAPQTRHVFTIQENAGWVISPTSKNLKLSSGANAVEVFVAIGGA